MLRVALTGGIATGKSHVAGRLRTLGVPVIDADELAHRALQPGARAARAVEARFGPGILGANGEIDRRRLGEVVFADRAARADLERIVHPEVYAAIEAWFLSLDTARSATPGGFAVADVPLLFETGHEADFDRVIVAACPPALQVRRVMKRDGLSESAAQARLAAQWPIAEKERLADFVIRTDGPFSETDGQVERVVEALRQAAERR